jgi:hypothetical protein
VVTEEGDDGLRCGGEGERDDLKVWFGICVGISPQCTLDSSICRGD